MVKSNVEVGNLNSFSAQIAKLQNDLDEYKKLSAQADVISQNAVTAAGGAGTQVGAALSSSFEQVNSDEMNGTIESLDKLILGTKHISKQMLAAYDDFLQTVKSVNADKD